MKLFKVVVTIGTGNPISGKVALMAEHWNSYDVFVPVTEDLSDVDSVESARSQVQDRIGDAHIGVQLGHPFWKDVQKYGAMISRVEMSEQLHPVYGFDVFFTYKPLFP